MRVGVEPSVSYFNGAVVVEVPRKGTQQHLQHTLDILLKARFKLKVLYYSNQNTLYA